MRIRYVEVSAIAVERIESRGCPSVGRERKRRSRRNSEKNWFVPDVGSLVWTIAAVCGNRRAIGLRFGCDGTEQREEGCQKL